MSRPRRQTYTSEMYLKKIKDGDIDNSADVQRNFVWRPEQINGLIVTVLTDDYIPPIILGEEDNTQLHIVDGGQRSAALKLFRHGNYKITSSVEDSIILYKKKVKENGRIVWEDAEFDIKNKTFEMLPEELQKKFDEYQIETVIHENCDRYGISKYIKRYNAQVPMNACQKAYTYIYNHAEHINKILESEFFVNHSNYTEVEKTKGTVERVVMESVMCMFHLDEWKKSAKQIADFLNKKSSKDEFETLASNLARLEKIISDDVKDVFNSKDSFIWLTFFDRFTKLGVEDSKFAEFLKAFKNGTRNKEVDGKLFDTVDQTGSTKDKAIIIAKLHILETLLHEFLFIDEDDLKEIDYKEFVKTNVEDIIDEDIEEVQMVANDVSEEIDENSWMLSEQNYPAYLAIVGLAFKKDMEDKLREWFPIYITNNQFIRNQQKAFLHMKESFETYLQKGMVA